jgi:uncharacterized protein
MAESPLFPYLGFGLGLRQSHYAYVAEHQPDLDWFEIISENFMELESGHGAPVLRYLDTLREKYPIVLHGVSLSLGSSDPLDFVYLQRLKQLADRFDPPWISDHACWSSVDGIFLHDLLPLPYTQAVLKHLVERIERVQDFLGRRILIENVSSYMSYAHSEMSEWEFLSQVAQQADCGLLLDVNNVYVSAINHDFEPWDFISGLPARRIAQIHMAGHTDFKTWLVDSHDHAIVEPVWELYRKTIRHLGPISSMIERDENIPEFPVLFAEMALMRQIAREALDGTPVSSCAT